MPSENDYKGKLKKAILASGVPCYSPTDRFQHGVPDIYISGGNWIECKIAPIGATRYYNAQNLITASQRQFMNQFQDAGDQCFVAIFWVVKGIGKNWCTITHWPLFKQIVHWTWKDVQYFGLPMKEGWPIEIFAPWYDRHCSIEGQTTHFNEWTESNPSNWDPGKQYD